MKERLIALGIAASAITGCSSIQPETTNLIYRIPVRQLLQNPDEYESKIVEIPGTLKFDGKKGNSCEQKVVYEMYSENDIKDKPFVKATQIFISKRGGEACDLQESKIPAYEGVVRAVIRGRVEKVVGPADSGEFPGNVQILIEGIYGVGYIPVF